MKHIVTGYDGSESAARAAGEAALLARATGAELHIINVVDQDPKRDGMMTAWVDTSAENAAAARREGVADLAVQEIRLLADQFADVTTHAIVLSGAPASVLVDHAESIGADLIVVGNRRVQGVSRALGSVAVDILRHSPCSVYVAHTS
jgi:nucleotide-binding universal stress UspA family protein